MLEGREREKNQTTTGDNPTIVSCHTPFQIEEDKMTHLGR
jgi:hypothetical protein